METELIEQFESTVLANFGAAVAVETSSGAILRAIPLKKVPLLVAGDRVVCDGDNLEELRITELQPRSTVLGRPDRRGQLKPIAANLTQLVIVSAVQPPPEPMLIDQFCVVAENSDIDAIIVLNKSDLLDSRTQDAMLPLLETYTDLGYKTALVNTHSEDGLASLSQVFLDQTSVLVGQSGVGKSSIVQQLLPDQDIRVGAISEATGIGSHTTTVSFRYTLDEGGVLIDSPGVRQFEVGYLSASQIANGYKEIAAIAEHCRFSDCRHRVEPDCAVKEAVDQNKINQLRYDNFLKLAAKQDESRL